MYTCTHVFTYLCMYVCSYLCMHVCVCVCTYVWMYLCTYVVCVYVSSERCTAGLPHASATMPRCSSRPLAKVITNRLLVCMYVSMYEHTYVCKYLCTYVCLYVCMYVCTYVCMCEGMYLCLCVRMYVGMIDLRDVVRRSPML